MADETVFNNEENEDDGYITLIDDNGESTRFDHLATVEYEGDFYLILSDPDTAEDEDQEVFILKIGEDEEGNEIYTALEDDDLADKVFEVFTQMLDDADGDGQ